MSTVRRLALMCLFLATTGCGGDDSGGDGEPNFVLAPPALDNSGTDSEWLGVDDRKQLSGLDPEERSLACDTMLAKLADNGTSAFVQTDCTFGAVYGQAQVLFLNSLQAMQSMSTADAGTTTDAGVADAGIGGPGTPGWEEALFEAALAMVDLEQCEVDVQACIAAGATLDANELSAFCEPAVQACNRPASDFDACQLALAAEEARLLDLLSCSSVADVTSDLYTMFEDTDETCSELFDQCRDLAFFLVL